MLDLLQGILIISFNHFLLGPMGIQALADLGTTAREWCTCAPTATSAASRSI